jgi:hypothetical protein
MYDSLVNFLTHLSTQLPLLWALLVMAVVAGAGLVLYLFWELLLRWLFSTWANTRRRTGGRG